MFINRCRIAKQKNDTFSTADKKREERERQFRREESERNRQHELLYVEISLERLQVLFDLQILAITFLP